MLSIVLFFNTRGTNAYADTTIADFKGFEISVRIESFDRTITKGNVYAVTFIEALQKIGADKNIEIVVSQNDNGNQKIFSIDGITNRQFGDYDGWNGFIIRDDAIWEPYNVLEQALKVNDEIVIYYGDIGDTKKVADIIIDESGNELTAKITSEYTTWIENDDNWQLLTITENIQDINVHLELNKNEQKNQMSKTDKDGLAKFVLERTGIYTAYAEGYIPKHYPRIVKTSEKKLLLYVNNDSALTRGEFIATIVNLLSMEKGNINFEINDLDMQHKNYNELTIALSNGLISGYTDKTIRANKNISSLEAYAILSRAFHSYENENNDYSLEGIPSWASNDIKSLIASGMIGEIDTSNINWYDNISSTDLLKLCS